MPTDDRLPSVLDRMGSTVAWIVMGVYAFSVAMPYFIVWLNPSIPGEILDIIKSNKSTVDLITTAVVMFFFGASVQRRKDQDTLGTLVKTNAAQVAALAPLPGLLDVPTIPVAPGEKVVVEGETSP